MRIYQSIIPIGIVSAIIAIALPVFAETKQINYTINSDGNVSFDILIQQAEALTSNLIQQEFAQSDVSEVAVTIVGDRNGQTVPLMLTKVSRSQWQTQPTLQPWIKYFNNSELLLGFLNFNQPTSTNLTTASIPRNIQDDPAYRDD